MTFHVGQRVVCVDDVFLHPGWGSVLNKPTRGTVYVVRGVQIEAHFDGLLLEEVINAPRQWLHVGYREMSFPAIRFRPLIERKSSTSTGFEILDGIRKRESVEEYEKRAKKVRA